MKKINELNNVEKKNQYTMILFLFGVVLGVAATFLLSSNKTMRQHLYIATGIQVSRLNVAKLKSFDMLVYSVAAVLAVSVLSLIIRFFSSSKTLPAARFFMKVLVGVAIGLPLTAFLFIIFDKYVQKFSANVALQVAFYILSGLIFMFFFQYRRLSGGFRDLVIQIVAETIIIRYFKLGDKLRHYQATAIMNLRIVILALFFALVFSVLTGLLGDMFCDIVKLPLKRCKLEIFQVINETDYGVHRQIMSSKSFPECFNAMKINGDSLWPNQFFRITEKNFAGMEVTHWDYYANGDVIHMTKEELCKSFTRTMKDAAGSAVIPNAAVKSDMMIGAAPVE
ncbi:MAG: hypothetical protein J5842_04300 [Lachnospiraceae bacterium]|nr:hypothetical protein [Lachnospiraceae bacterium]